MKVNCLHRTRHPQQANTETVQSPSPNGRKPIYVGGDDMMAERWLSRKHPIRSWAEANKIRELGDEPELARISEPELGHWARPEWERLKKQIELQGKALRAL